MNLEVRLVLQHKVEVLVLLVLHRPAVPILYQVQELQFKQEVQYLAEQEYLHEVQAVQVLQVIL